MSLFNVFLMNKFSRSRLLNALKSTDLKKNSSLPALLEILFHFFGFYPTYNLAPFPSKYKMSDVVMTGLDI